MKSANSVLTLLVVLFFEKLKAELLDVSCLPRMMPMMINSTNAGLTPWIVYLTRNGKHICSGSLITKRFVLTAAHCAISTENLIARLGEYDTSTTEDGQHINLPIINIFQPNDGNDIALLKLSQPVLFTDNIKPICIPIISYYKTIALEKNQFSVTGWGQKSRYDVASATKLQEISVRVRMLRCDSPEGQLCFENTSQFICHGDSGSPLIADVPYHELTIAAQFGIVSRGHDRCYNHAFYVDVNKYVSWIQESIAQNNV